MTLVAVYRFDEAGNVTRNGQLGSEDPLTVLAGTTDSAAALLGNGYANTSAATCRIGKNSPLANAGLAQARSVSIGFWSKNFGTAPVAASSLQLRNTEFQLSMLAARNASNFTCAIATTGGNEQLNSGILGGTNAWHHTVMTLDHTTQLFCLYIDAVLKASMTLTFAAGEDVEYVPTIDWTDLWFNIAPNQVVDQLMIDNTAVSLATVQQWYNSGAGYDPTALAEPDAVDDLAAAPGTQQLTFTWTAPPDGGSAITKYSLYLNGVLHTDNVTSPKIVSGLTGGVLSGAWTVTATNNVGESDPSNAVSATPLSVPNAVNDLAAEAGVEKLTFTWTPPANTGGAAITKYTLYLDGVLHTDNVTSPKIVTGLTPNVASGEWTVTATNSIGESAASNAVTSTPYAAGPFIASKWSNWQPGATKGTNL